MTAVASSAPHPVPIRVPDPLAAAIIRTVAYADVFDFAPTIDEVHRYLIGASGTPTAVRMALSGTHPVSGSVAVRSGHVTLPGRRDLVAVRLQRSAETARLLRRAVRYARAVGSLPFVRMVAISGALAAGNAVSGDDIDLFVVTSADRLWLARAGSIAVVRFVALRGDELCPNYLLAETALAMDERDLYAATELAHLVPVVGWPVYQRLRQANRWAADHLPEADGAPELTAGVRLVTAGEPSLLPVLRSAAEALLRTPLGSTLEAWERGRKVARFRSRAAGSDEAWADTAFAVDRCKGHFESHRARIRVAYEQRARSAGVEPLWVSGLQR